MEITILGISSSPIKNSNTEAFLKEALKAAGEVEGVSTDIIPLAGKTISDCIHCNWCVSKQKEGKACSLEDDMVDIYPRVLAADGLVLSSPVYLARLSGMMAAFLDRLRCFLHGNHYHGVLQNKVGGALAVAWFRNAGPETTLQTLASAFLAFGMIYPGMATVSNCAWGAAGVSSKGGMGKFDPDVKLGVLDDEFGLRSARSVGKRVAEVAKILKSGQSLLKEKEK
ncbi:MAG: flavodoxin family protein [Desulfatiglans sp.]|nr:flavodoxin family protein [Thermodesulfobacteriota bacterium]MEE4352362.1 flavodoxin family protein [Desulfatiglans sp.]